MECDVMYASFAGIEIPNVVDVQVDRIFQGDRSRTAGGKLRQDAVAVKRVWTLVTGKVPRAKILPLLNHLEGTLYAEGAFWLKEFGSSDKAVRAIIGPENIDERIVQFGSGGMWHDDGRQLTLIIEEV